MVFLFDFIGTIWPGKSKFDPARDIPDLSGRVFIVTGGNSGCGYYTVKALLEKNGRVYLGCRNETKALQAIDDLEKETGTKGKGLAHFLKLDLADLKSIRAAVEEFNKKETRLDVLYNNAGVMVPPMEQLTEQGYDLQFGSNVLGPFYLTRLLLPLLIQTAKSNDSSKGISGRVINTSSLGHQIGAPKIDYRFVTDTPERRKQSINNLYAASKLGLVIYAVELQRRYGDEGIVSASLNPGNLRTQLARNVPSIQRRIMFKLFCHPAPMGALTQLYAGTTPNSASVAGKYFIPWAKEGTPRPSALDPKEGEKLWKWCEEQVKKLD